MQPLFNASFQRPVARPRPYPAPYSNVLPFNTQTPREAPVPAFYNYRPNEVKHRKRTTRAQTKILEEQFKTTDKPDAGTRSDLSIRLGMTPREVQVWFQNRRAKEKKLRVQAQAALNQENEQARSSTPENEASSRAISPSVIAPTDADFSHTPPPNYADVPQLMAEPASASAMPDSASRPSNDTDSPSTVQGMQHNDRKNSPLTVPVIPTLPRVVSVPAIPSISTTGLSQSSSAPATSVGTRSFMGFSHRGSLPHIPQVPYTVEQTHQRSISSPGFTPPSSVSENPSPPGTVPSFGQTQTRYNFTAAYPKTPSYVFPPRVSQAPVSGPLPTPNYSFGAPVYAKVENGEDDGTIPYAQHRGLRFGSIDSVASLAGSDTTKSAVSLPTTDVTHTTFEDDTSFAFNSEQRRPSYVHSIGVCQ